MFYLAFKVFFSFFKTLPFFIILNEFIRSDIYVLVKLSKADSFSQCSFIESSRFIHIHFPLHFANMLPLNPILYTNVESDFS